MDISILLALQNFRNTTGAFLADFLSKMTFFGELNTTLVIFSIIYWCVSKDFGTYLMMGWGGNRLFNGFLKITACVYRPWIRDERIIPYGNSMNTATGYSFPSGHTTNVSTYFGGITVRKDKSKTLRIISFIIICLVAFSRLYLGVHTPQDVLVSAIGGLLIMWLTTKLMKWLDENPDKDYIVVIIGIILAIGLAIYGSFKSYLVDYNAAGELIVDGKKMANDTFKGVGWVIAFLIGWLLEKKFINFTTDITLEKRVIRLLAGMLLFYVVSLIVMPWIKQIFVGSLGTIISCFIQMFFITFIYPLLIKQFEK